MALDNCGSYLVTGSRDCTCIIWSIQNSHSSSGPATSNIPVHALTSQTNLQSIIQLNTQNSFSPKPLTTLYGHDDSISSVAIYTELDMVVSGSLVRGNIYKNMSIFFVRYCYGLLLNFIFRMALLMFTPYKMDNFYAH